MNGYNLDKNKCIALLIFGFVATSIGVFIRLYLPLEANFPLNDGGLFYTFSKDIIDSNFKLPFYTSYNYYQIPFAYPPLSFYMIAAISFIFKMDLLFAIRLVPPIITIFTIPAFFLFSYSYYKNAVNVIFAVFSYVFLPWSYMWLIMGGGVSRSVGAFFGILSLHSIFLLYTKRKKIFIISSGIFSSLTILSHLGFSAFVFISALIFILFLGRNRTSIIYSLYVGILVLVLTSPWWFTIITRHGIEPILSALNSGYGDYRKNAIINLIFLGLQAKFH